MGSNFDRLIDIIEDRRRKLESFVDACKLFKRSLDELPPELAREAEKMLFSELGGESTSRADVEPDLMGKTALECVEIILNEHGNQPMHFSTVAKEAIRRGYKGRLVGNEDEIESTTIKSFWAAMSRSDELEAAGRGMYKLKSGSDGASPSAFEKVARSRWTQGDAAEQALLNAGVELRLAEIVSFIRNNALLSVPTGKAAYRNFSNAVWAAMSRDKRFVRTGRGRWALSQWVSHRLDSAKDQATEQRIEEDKEMES